MSHCLIQVKVLAYSDNNLNKLGRLSNKGRDHDMLSQSDQRP